jgi:hypothetical protein
LRGAPIVLVGEVTPQRNLDVRRLRNFHRRDSVEGNAGGEFGYPESTDDGDCAAQAEAGQFDLRAIAAYHALLIPPNLIGQEIASEHQSPRVRYTKLYSS